MPKPTYQVPPQFNRLLGDFETLLEQHPGAADRFVLADVGANARRLRTSSGRILPLECVDTDDATVCKFEKVK
jgi:hypothetical protein